MYNYETAIIYIIKMIHGRNVLYAWQFTTVYYILPVVYNRAWLWDTESTNNYAIKKLSDRIEDITGLETQYREELSSSEPFQVSYILYVTRGPVVYLTQPFQVSHIYHAMDIDIAWDIAHLTLPS